VPIDPSGRSMKRTKRVRRSRRRTVLGANSPGTRRFGSSMPKPMSYVLDAMVGRDPATTTTVALRSGSPTSLQLRTDGQLARHVRHRHGRPVANVEPDHGLPRADAEPAKRALVTAVIR
jgi:hypothetical protein